LILLRRFMRIANNTFVIAALVVAPLLAQIDYAYEENTAADFEIDILYPATKAAVTYAPGGLVKGVLHSSEPLTLQIMQPATVSSTIDVSTDTLKKDFPRHIYELFPTAFQISDFELVTNNEQGIPTTTNYTFYTLKRATIEAFWETLEFRKILAQVYDPDVLSATVTLKGNSGEAYLLNPDGVNKTRDVFSFRLGLQPGINTFALEVLNSDNDPIHSDSVSFFYAPLIADSDAPDGFSSLNFHNDGEEERCITCHKELETEECSACHSSVVSHETVHPPAEDGDCTACHDSDTSPKYELLSEFRDEPDGCLDCHSDISDNMDEAETIHPPAEETCLNCHDPHSSPNISMLVFKPTDTCLVCHDDKEEGNHPVDKHPIRGEEDPRRPERPFSCASCHNPHSSEHSTLLRNSWMKLCGECHKK